MTANKLPTYTKAEAAALEDHYIKGYTAAGLIGKGKPPSNDKRTPFNVTPAGRARQLKATAAKERAYNLIAKGHGTVAEVSAIMKCTGTPVRRYFRQLADEGRIEVAEDKPGVVLKWRIRSISPLSPPDPHLEAKGGKQTKSKR